MQIFGDYLGTGEIQRISRELESIPYSFSNCDLALSNIKFEEIFVAISKGDFLSCLFD